MRHYFSVQLETPLTCVLRSPQHVWSHQHSILFSCLPGHYLMHSELGHVENCTLEDGLVFLPFPEEKTTTTMSTTTDWHCSIEDSKPWEQINIACVTLQLLWCNTVFILNQSLMKFFSTAVHMLGSKWLSNCAISCKTPYFY